MHSKVYIYRVTCPDCGAVHYGFIGDNEDGSFQCNETIEIKRGNKTTTEECDYFIEKIHHMPDDSYEIIKTIKIEDFDLATKEKSSLPKE